MTTDSFEAFFAARQVAAASYVGGDGAPLDQLVPHRGEATFHSPNGETIAGASEVAARYLADAKSFSPEGQTHFEVLQLVSDDNLAFWTGFQIATVTMRGQNRPMQMRIRVTEIFRRIDGRWNLIHRHADVGSKPGR